MAPGLLLLGGTAGALCPPDCLPGGGRTATDCLVQFGRQAAGPPAPATTCTDGDPSCDLDGVADGTCTFDVQVCVNVPGPSCDPEPLASPPTVKPPRDPVAQALAQALADLGDGTAACTPPGIAVPVKVTPGRLRPGRVRLTVVAGAGRQGDRDRLTLTCQPGAAPSFAAAVQPVLSARCAIPACHSGIPPRSEPSLEAGRALDAIVNRRALVGRLPLVQPGKIGRSYLARKIFGRRIKGLPMPFGCPGAPPAGGCLTAAETYTILSWIQGGARDD